MSTLACLLEEPSAQAMLEGVLPKILPDGVIPKYIVFEGKQDFEKRIEKKLKNWQIPHTYFLLLRDQDAGNCREIKDSIVLKCANARKTGSLVRIACKELESFYLGDLEAVEKGLELSGLSNNQGKRKYRNPDLLGNPSQELIKVTGKKYQKVAGSRSIAPHLKLDLSNCSPSFNALITGLRRLFMECHKQE